MPHAPPKLFRHELLRESRWWTWASDSLAEWSKALASGASPQGRGLEPHSCQLAHKRQRAQLHVDRARSALLASSGSCPQQNKGEMCCLSVFYPGCLVDMSSPASMPAVVSSRKLQCCCCSSEHDSLAEWSKALASGASPQGRGLEPHSCHWQVSVIRKSRTLYSSTQILAEGLGLVPGYLRCRTWTA